MPSFQQIIIVGHLGSDPEIRHMPNGEAIANFSVATSEKWKDKNTGEAKEQTEWHRIVVFGKSAEAYVGRYLHKGDSVMIVGKIHTRKWQDKQGNDRYTTEIRADRFGGVQGMGGSRKANATNSQPGGDDGGQARGRQGVGSGTAQGGAHGGFSINLPFAAHMKRAEYLT